MAAGYFAYSDDEVRSLWEVLKAAKLAGKTLVAWTSGDSSATKQVNVNVEKEFPVVATEMLRRFPDQVGRRPVTRTRVRFA